VIYREAGQFKSTYAADQAVFPIRQDRIIGGLALVAAVVALPLVADEYWLQAVLIPFLIYSLAALGLNLLTGYAGQVSLGTGGFMAVGAYAAYNLALRIPETNLILVLLFGGLMATLVGILFGLPSLRLRGLYLAVSTLALHFVVIYLGGEYETKRGFSTGILVEPPSLAGFKLSGGRFWYFVLLAAAALSLLICINLLRSRSGRAFRAVHARETVADALGISIAGTKLLAFVISSAMTSVAGCLFAYYRGFVSVEAFDLFLSIQYVAMIIIGGMGSLLGALLGAAFVTLFPYAIEALLHLLPNADKLAGDIFAVNYASFGVVMILFLVFEPLGLVGIWHRLQNYFLLWPFRYRPLAGARK